MTVANPPESLQVWRCFEGLLVRCDRQGVAAANDGAPWSSLDLPRLALLVELARGGFRPHVAVPALAARFGVERPQLHGMLMQLRKGGCILRDPADAEPAPPRAAPEAGASPDPERLVGSLPDTLDGPAAALLRVTPEGFEWTSHEGERLLLGPAEILAFRGLLAMPAWRDAYRDQVERLGRFALDASAFASLLQRLVGVALLVPSALGAAAVGSARSEPNDPLNDTPYRAALLSEYAAIGAAYDEEHRGDTRAQVVAVNTTLTTAPAALGLLLEYAKAHDHGRLVRHYAFRPELFWDAQSLGRAKPHGRLFLFSNYLWNHKANLALSAVVKEQDSAALTIHGGPNTPAYASDTEQYFLDNPHVDVTVRGEGEATFVALLEALTGQLDSPTFDLSALAEVPGISFRQGGRVVRTADRERIADLDAIPSPILAGLYAPFVRAYPPTTIVIESNRGCPFGCTFCDWGSATLSKIRKFDLDRVMAELEWCSNSRVDKVVLADANFGVFERDVEIAEKFAALKSERGFPRLLGTNYAKNGARHLPRIVETLTRAGVVAEGKVSLQTHDAATLVAIRRKNIKLESYDVLAGEFQKRGLPMSIELMMGLPGATMGSFAGDLQESVDRDVRSFVYTTMLLPNSPMNDPEYRATHGIVAKPGEIIRETSSYTHAEWTGMRRLSQLFMIADFYGVYRHVATYVRSATGIREVEFYQELLRAATDERTRWPMMAATLEVMHRHLLPPSGWRPLIAELQRYLVGRMGIADDSALQTALSVQLALLPSWGRRFPHHEHLPHDYEAWYRLVTRARAAADQRKSWERHVPPLRSLPGGVLTVTDPNGICAGQPSGALLSDGVQSGVWELGSRVSRNFVAAEGLYSATGWLTDDAVTA